MRHAIPFGLLALLVLSACSHVGDEEAGAVPDEILLTNALGETLYFTALEAELSSLVDPLPAFHPDSTDAFPAVAPGATVPVREIDAYEPGDDVRFFLYAERSGGDDGAAVFAGVLTVTNEELRRSGGRVVVDEL